LYLHSMTSIPAPADAFADIWKVQPLAVPDGLFEMAAHIYAGHLIIDS
jgi:hypothetical protein